MKKEDLYKKIVLGLLFVFPLLVYLFFASGKNNFAKLPILSKGITEIQNLEFQADNPVSLKDQISIIGYWGGSLKNKQAEALNLNEKIYKRFYEFADFQFVFFVNKNRLSQVDSLKRALKEGVGTDLTKWNFIAATTDEIQTHFTSLQTPIKLDQDGSTPYVFIIDKDLNLRGRNDDEDSGTLYGFDARSVAQINKKMIDDVKVILAEYRLALKIYNNKRKK
ncbi:MAG: hypothetical protein HOM76_00550 [Flavobacteriaceae bacterium]|jgi:hypothetical protein|nr:hypothetical protein [Flavobacteriaceae bacterium]MBT4313060.1 hypothetical protein [Flavobacteriaceae bacterium]MBT5090887.1 hypothetical protein [Flavobacteriaceae bacterium]MBT5282804.1 hypothetical protein [Flavobacteriaceae bacterium]MBT5446130.1 hypothetical protein [Flavobacteriaceae bacterium]|tara:strand:- start:21549 stop:22214 length:666 start_codon:yes stop_codon:yes gene_type:complete